MAFEPVRTLADLEVLNEADIVEGYLSAERGDPEPGENRGRAFWHGWRNRMIDLGVLPPDDASQALAREFIARPRTSRNRRNLSLAAKTTTRTYYGAYRLVALSPHGSAGSVGRLVRDPTVAVVDPADIGKPEVAKGRILQHPFPLLPPPPGGWDRNEWEQMRAAILAIDPAAADALALLDDRGCRRQPEKPSASTDDSI